MTVKTSAPMDHSCRSQLPKSRNSVFSSHELFSLGKLFFFLMIVSPAHRIAGLLH
jgi:hypothetical protein